jgi:hypothetical protein
VCPVHPQKRAVSVAPAAACHSCGRRRDDDRDPELAPYKPQKTPELSSAVYAQRLSRLASRLAPTFVSLPATSRSSGSRNFHARTEVAGLDTSRRRPPENSVRQSVEARAPSGSHVIEKRRDVNPDHSKFGIHNTLGDRAHLKMSHAWHSSGLTRINQDRARRRRARFGIAVGIGVQEHICIGTATTNP